ncbi:Enolase-phosphatase E1, partial [Fragariocoptes setiger]
MIQDNVDEASRLLACKHMIKQRHKIEAGQKLVPSNENHSQQAELCAIDKSNVSIACTIRCYASHQSLNSNDILAARLRTPACIILDIEGTTTSLRFIKDTLFPYIRRNIYRYLKERWNTEEVQVTLARLYRQEDRDRNDGFAPPKLVRDINADPDRAINSLVSNVLWQMDNKRHNTALKQLQILVWVYGYESGELKGHVYDDVGYAFRRWRSMGIRLFVYSTGMAVAQQLLFSNSTQGNLLNLIENYFDLLIGPKTSSSSFKKLSHQYIMIPPRDILFISDSHDEARAAREAGCQAILIQRPENKPLSAIAAQEFPIVSSLSQIEFSAG